MMTTAKTKALRTMNSTVSTVSRVIDRLPARLAAARKEGLRLGAKVWRHLKRRPLLAAIGSCAVGGLVGFKIAKRA